jgi:hypothetical protein
VSERDPARFHSHRDRDLPPDDDERPEGAYVDEPPAHPDPFDRAEAGTSGGSGGDWSGGSGGDRGGGTSGGSGADRGGGPPGEYAGDYRFPWPPAEGESVVAAFGETWQGASLSPRRFFRALPEHGSIRSALLYYLPLGIAVAGANLFWSLTLLTRAEEQEVVLGELPLGGMSPLLEFLVSPLILLASIFVAAGVTHGLLSLFGGANRSFAFTTRVYAYAYSPQILTLLPVIGAVAGFIWMVVVAIIGLKEGHRTSAGRVIAAVMIPVTIALLFMAVAAFIATTGRLLTH